MAYASLFLRLVANTQEPPNEQACWTWAGPTRRHGGGHRPAVCIRDERGPRNQNAARVMIEQFQELPPELEASHLCRDNWLCVNPDHLIGEGRSANQLRVHGHDVPLPVAAAEDLGEWWLGKRGGKRCPF